MHSVCCLARAEWRAVRCLFRKQRPKMWFLWVELEAAETRDVSWSFFKPRLSPTVGGKKWCLLWISLLSLAYIVLFIIKISFEVTKGECSEISMYYNSYKWKYHSAFSLQFDVILTTPDTLLCSNWVKEWCDDTGCTGLRILQSGC